MPEKLATRFAYRTSQHRPLREGAPLDRCTVRFVRDGATKAKRKAAPHRKCWATIFVEVFSPSSRRKRSVPHAAILTSHDHDRSARMAWTN
jgi:hypothetical protein